MNQRAIELANGLREKWSGPMTEEEVAFLRDIQGFIEFAIRNGLSFPMVMSGLVHDIEVIKSSGFDYKEARSRGFSPKVAGYSDLTEDDFGDDDEEPSS